MRTRHKNLETTFAPTTKDIIVLEACLFSAAILIAALNLV